jgi:hypothetical protein
MKCLKIVMPLLAVAFFATIFCSQAAKADVWNKKTIMTFSGPVELPGVVLPAGTYVFKLADSSSDRNIVQVFNKDESQIYATILAVPDYRLKPTGKPVITFEERAKGTPEAVKAWFYPGDHYGEEFVYPKPRAIELAKANNQHVPSMPALMARSVTKPLQSPEVQAMKKAPITAIQPSGKEVQLSEVHPPQPPAQTAPATTQMAMTKTRTLPKTASPLPWFLLIGTVSLTGALALRLAARKSS